MTPSTRRSRSLIALLLVVALALGGFGSAVAGPAVGLTKAQVKKLVKQGIAKEAPKLTVARAATADTVDGIDSANLMRTPGALRVVAAAALDGDGTILTSVGQFTVAKTGTGAYQVTPVGQTVTLDKYVLMATPGISFQVRALVQVGKANFYTSNAAGSPQDGAFQFVIYRVG